MTPYLTKEMLPLILPSEPVSTLPVLSQLLIPLLLHYVCAAHSTADGSVCQGNPQLMSTPIGTPKFMAPEIMNVFDPSTHASSYSGAAVDCWAAGIVVYVMVAAAFPWTLATKMAMMEHGEQQPPSLEYSEHAAGNWRMPAGFTPELTDFLHHACAIDPTQRSGLVFCVCCYDWMCVVIEDVGR